LYFISSCIANGYLKEGDYLICDNATVHGGLDSIGILKDILATTYISLRYLPSYSPELNPAELGFMKVKRQLRESRNQEVPLWFDIAAAFSLITHEDLVKFYLKCLFS